jgi:hypothetical protein
MTRRRKFAWLILAAVLAILGELPATFAADAEDAFWRSVVKGNVVEEYEIYLQQYPKGRYIVEAKQLVDKLIENRRLLDELRQIKEIDSRRADELRLLKEKDSRRAVIAPQPVESAYGHADMACETAANCTDGQRCRSKKGGGTVCRY